MPTIIIFELDTDPFGSASVGVSDSFTVEINDNVGDTTFERTDSDGSSQFDISTLPNFQGGSNSTQVFESYSGDINGDPVTFTLLQFSGALYMVVNSGDVEVGDTIDNTNNSPNINNSPNVEFNTLADFVCFCRGTEVSTPYGPRAVETLETGDLVNVLGKPPQRLKWVGTRYLNRTELSREPHLGPVRISAHALGFGVPSQDVFVSPQHRVLLDGMRLDLLFGHRQMLCPAKALVNDFSITQDHDCVSAEYWHLLLEGHEVVETSGLWSETLFVGPTVMAGFPRATVRHLQSLHPNLKNNPDSFGPTAYPALTVREGALLRSSAETLGSSTYSTGSPKYANGFHHILSNQYQKSSRTMRLPPASPGHSSARSRQQQQRQPQSKPSIP